MFKDDMMKKLVEIPLDKIDLHAHTTYSDGRLRPSQLIEMQLKKGMKLVAIADHDTLGGLKEARDKAYALGVDFFTGIEISSSYNDIQLHILGYGVDEENQDLKDLCQDMLKDRIEKNKLIFKVIEKDFNIDIERLLSPKETDYIGKPDMGRVLIEKGFFKDLEEAFKNYFKKDIIEGIKRITIPAKDAIKVILSSGGVPILAHPILIKGIGIRGEESFYYELRKLLLVLKEMGLMGIEADYSKNSSEETEVLKTMAKEMGFLITRGSDFHG